LWRRRENNTHALLLAGWRGVWIDAMATSRDSEAITVASTLLAVECARVDRDNVLAVVTRRWSRSRAGKANELDLLSSTLTATTWPSRCLCAGAAAKIIVVEYNAKLRWPLTFEVCTRPIAPGSATTITARRSRAGRGALGPPARRVQCRRHQRVFCSRRSGGRVSVLFAGAARTTGAVHMAALRSGHAPTLKFLPITCRQDGER